MSSTQKSSTNSTKLLIATDGYPPRWDGIGRFLTMLEPRLKGFSITVAAPDFGKHKTKNKVVRFPLMKKRFGDIYFAKPDKKRIRKLVQEADVVFSQSIGPIGGLAIREAKRQNKPVVSYLHNIEWELARRSLKRLKRISSLIVKWWAKSTYNKCTKLIAPNNTTANKFREIGIKTPIKIIPLGIDTKKFKPTNTRLAQRKLKLTGPVIGFCGRIGREKDLSTLYKAFKQVQEKHPKAKLLIVGTGLEPEFLDDRAIKAVGKQDDVVPYLQAMDIFVLPSLIETTSLATMEAMSCGIPVIATPVGSIPEYVHESVNGMLFTPGHVEELATKIDVLLHNDAMRTQLGKNARRTIVQNYQFAITAKKISSVLKPSS